MASLPSTVTFVTGADCVPGRGAVAGDDFASCAPAAIGNIPAAHQIPNSICRRILVMYSSRFLLAGVRQPNSANFPRGDPGAALRALCAGPQRYRILSTYKAPLQRVKESPAHFLG